MLQSEQNSQWTFLFYHYGKGKKALSNSCTTFMISVSFPKKKNFLSHTSSKIG